jgi:hypothetical protein
VFASTITSFTGFGKRFGRHNRRAGLESLHIQTDERSSYNHVTCVFEQAVSLYAIHSLESGILEKIAQEIFI